MSSFWHRSLPMQCRLPLTGHSDLGHIVAFHNGYTVFRVEPVKLKPMHLRSCENACQMKVRKSWAWNEQGSSCIKWLRDAAG